MSQGANSNKDSSNSNNNKRKRGRRNETPEVKTSKALSWALRHQASSLGLDMGVDGYVPLDQLLSHSHPKFRGMTEEGVRSVVDSNDKQRFSLIERDGAWFIRANQGHSIATIDPHLLLTPIDPSTLPTIVHGTYMDVWTNHIQTQGLSKMNRNHIHFAKGMPSDDGVISGMRKTCSVYIFCNGKQCAEDGIEFFESANGVILTSGIEGILPPKYFTHVLSKSGEVLLDKRSTAVSTQPASAD